MPQLPRNIYRRGRMFYVRVRQPDGSIVRRSAGRTLEAALQLRDELEDAPPPAETAAEPDPDSLGPAIERFLASRRAEGVRPDTLEFYTKVLRYWTTWLGAECRLDRITRDRVERIVRSRGVSPHTKAKELRALRALLRWAGLDPDLPRIRVDEPQPEVLTADELRAVLNAAPDDWVGALIHLTAATGIRHSELLRLPVGAVDLEALEIRIPAHVAKTRKARDIPLSEATAARLRPFVDGRDPKAILFAGRGGKPRRDAYSQVREVFATAGVQTRKKLHALRATAASDLLEDGTDFETTGELLGWERRSRYQVAAHYSKTSGDAKREAIRRRAKKRQV